MFPFKHLKTTSLTSAFMLGKGVNSDSKLLARFVFQFLTQFVILDSLSILDLTLSDVKAIVKKSSFQPTVR